MGALIFGAGFALLASSCLEPPELPGNAATLGGVSDGTGNSGATAGSGGTGGSSGDGMSTDGDGPAGSSGENGESGSSGETGQLTAGSTGGAGSESTGAQQPPPPWYAGAYSGVWSGDCPGQVPLSGGGTWTVDIEDDGTISGSYAGTLSVVGGVDGLIVGTVDNQGVTEATASGDALGECNWDGMVENNGEAQGSLDCSLDCSGDWSGEKQ